MKIILQRAEVTYAGRLWMYLNERVRDVRYFYTWRWILKWVLYEATK